MAGRQDWNREATGSYSCPSPRNVSKIPSICSVRLVFLRPKWAESWSGVAVGQGKVDPPSPRLRRLGRLRRTSWGLEIGKKKLRCRGGWFVRAAFAWVGIPDRSFHPILKFQTGHFLEIHRVTGEQDRIMFHDDAGDSRVHRTDPHTLFSKLQESRSGFPVE